LRSHVKVMLIKSAEMLELMDTPSWQYILPHATLHPPVFDR
jgi:hypothetical protein